MKKQSALCIFFSAASFFICLGVIFAAGLSCVYNQNHMMQAFLQYAEPYGHDEISREDFSHIAAEIIRYLQEGKNVPSIRNAPLFSEKENQHLLDCFHLLRGMTFIRWIALMFAVLLFVFIFSAQGETCRQRANISLKSFAFGASVFLAFVLAVSLWGLLNFNGLFITFHKVCFRNDLWILNPQEDLLIQLMPFSFFTDYASYILKTLAPVLIILASVPVVCLILWRKEKKKESVI